MTHRAPTKSSRGAIATGATATGAASLAAMAMGALALGAMAVGALAIGRLSVGRARLRRVEIGELAVGRLEVGADGIAGRPTAVCRIRAAPGKGDDLERLVLGGIGGSEPGVVPYRAHRSSTDPDLFLFYEARARDRALGRHRQAPHFDAVLRQAAEQGLVAATGDDPVEIELYRTI
jgi:quinol monooxygenase YgiN